MRIEAIRLHRVRMPLVEAWHAAHGVETDRELVLVSVAGAANGSVTEGWGECGALAEPTYSPEWTDGAFEVLHRFLAPRLVGHDVAGGSVSRALAAIAGHPMAKAALEMALLDGELRAIDTSLAEFLGATRDRVPVGVAIGITEPVERCLDAIERFGAEGYARVKLKIAPGHDVALVRAARERFPDLTLQVDANGSYSPDDLDALLALDPFELSLIEQPFPADDLPAHAAFARRSRTPVCLDESIGSVAAARTAIELGACTVVNVKASRVGGYLEARRVHDECVSHGVDAFVGGMLESGIGRAANLALAALPGFTLAGDLSASGRYYERDVTEPFRLDDDGCMTVPRGPGIGVTPIADVLREFTVSVATVER